MRWLISLCFACSLISLAGCSGPDNIPSGVLSRDKMQQVLWDIIEADEYSVMYLQKDSARIDVKSETAGLYEQVFELHKISRDQFNKSIRYYFSRPDIAKPLFDSLAAMGMRKRTEDYTHPAKGAASTILPNGATPPATIPPRGIPHGGFLKGKASKPIVPGHTPVKPPVNTLNRNFPAPSHNGPNNNGPNHNLPAPGGKMPKKTSPHAPGKTPHLVRDSVSRKK